jgi:pimeloyl-ACP methyl ester carboxylesterase
MPRRISVLAVIALSALLTSAKAAEPVPTNGDFAGLIKIGGGRKLYLECSGAGVPIVILEAGLRNRGDIWSVKPDAGAAVFPEVADFTRVCAYDRPGGSRAHRIATKSSHYVQIEEPQLVTDAIRQAVEAARAEKPPR